MHDRILTGLFAGAAVLTDHTGYLDEIVCNNKNSMLFFDADKTDSLPGIISSELLKPEQLYKTAQNGQIMAGDRFGYSNIVGQLLEIIKDTDVIDNPGR